MKQNKVVCAEAESCDNKLCPHSRPHYYKETCGWCLCIKRSNCIHIRSEPTRKEVLKAIQGSIVKWHNNCFFPEKFALGECPLCKLYKKYKPYGLSICGNCVLNKYTNNGCGGTSFHIIRNLNDLHKDTTEESKKMLLFLHELHAWYVRTGAK